MTTATLDRSFTPLCGDIGEPVRRREYEPTPTSVPVKEPSPEIDPIVEPAPAEPEKEPIPA